jgi:hypothetical protein
MFFIRVIATILICSPRLLRRWTYVNSIQVFLVIPIAVFMIITSVTFYFTARFAAAAAVKLYITGILLRKGGICVLFITRLHRSSIVSLLDIWRFCFPAEHRYLQQEITRIT